MDEQTANQLNRVALLGAPIVVGVVYGRSALRSADARSAWRLGF